MSSHDAAHLVVLDKGTHGSWFHDFNLGIQISGDGLILSVRTKLSYDF